MFRLPSSSGATSGSPSCSTPFVMSARSQVTGKSWADVAAGRESAQVSSPVPPLPASSPQVLKANRALWGHSVQLEDMADYQQMEETELYQRTLEFSLLALADKVDLPIEHPESSWEIIGLRLWIDGFAKIAQEQGLPPALERMQQALQHLWGSILGGAPESTDRVVDHIKNAQEVAGVCVPWIALPLLDYGDHRHFVSLSFRQQSNGKFSCLFADSDPGLDPRFLGGRVSIQYRFRNLTESDMGHFFQSPTGQDILCGTALPAQALDLLEALQNAFGRPEEHADPWLMQQVQWRSSCLPKSLFVLCRHEFLMGAQSHAEAVEQLYQYKLGKGAISKALLELLQEASEGQRPLPEPVEQALEICARRVQLRQRYQSLEQSIHSLQLRAEQHQLVVQHTWRSVRALQHQARSGLLLRNSKPSLEKFLTLQCPQMNRSLDCLERALRALERGQEPEQADTVAMAVLHWGDRTIRPIDDKKEGTLLEVAEEQRSSFLLRRYLCFTALRNLDAKGSDRASLKRFYQVLAGHAAKAPPRSPLGSPIRGYGLGEEAQEEEITSFVV